MSRIVSKTFAIALAAGLAAASPAAFAAPGDTTTAAAPSASARQTIDAKAMGSLTIDKRSGEVGSENKLEGMKFQIEKVQMDNSLDTAAGWKEAGDKVAAGPDAATIDSGFEAKELTTDASGTAKFDGLLVGLYKVTEVPVQGSKYTVGSPFLVTIPMTQEDGSINYNPTVSPKNQLIQPKKTSTNNNANVGDNIGYTITAPVPAGDVDKSGARTLPKLQVTDDLSEYLKYASTPDQVSVAAKGVDLVRGEDYTVQISGKNLTVDFTDSGLQKLAQARADHPDLAVEIKFDAEVVRIPANGQITNTAVEHINGNDINTSPTDKTDGPTVTHYNDVSITKNLNGNPTEDGKNGDGAEFQVFECTEQSGKWTVADGAAPIKGANAGGTAAADATLKAVGTDNTKAAVADGYFLQFDPAKDYCAVETKAPAGYLVNPDPQHLTASQDKRDERVIFTATVDDVKDNIWGKLPATGMRTMLIILGLGALLFIGGAAYQLKRRNA